VADVQAACPTLVCPNGACDKHSTPYSDASTLHKHLQKRYFTCGQALQQLLHERQLAPSRTAPRAGDVVPSAPGPKGTASPVKKQSRREPAVTKRSKPNSKKESGSKKAKTRVGLPPPVLPASADSGPKDAGAGDADAPEPTLPPAAPAPPAPSTTSPTSPQLDKARLIASITLPALAVLDRHADEAAPAVLAADAAPSTPIVGLARGPSPTRLDAALASAPLFNDDEVSSIAAEAGAVRGETAIVAAASSSSVTAAPGGSLSHHPPSPVPRAPSPPRFAAAPSSAPLFNVDEESAIAAEAGVVREDTAPVAAASSSSATAAPAGPPSQPLPSDAQPAPVARTRARVPSVAREHKVWLVCDKNLIALPEDRVAANGKLEKVYPIVQCPVNIGPDKRSAATGDVRCPVRRKSTFAGHVLPWLKQGTHPLPLST